MIDKFLTDIVIALSISFLIVLPFFTIVECTNKDNKIKKPIKIVAEKEVKLKPVEMHASKESRNKWYFRTKIYPELRKSECNKCEKLCHYDPHDRGGLTCVGISFNNNPNWYVNELNSFNSNCKVSAVGNYIKCDTMLLEIAAKELYWKKYASPFQYCSKAAFMMVVDSAVLEGVRIAKKHLKKAGGCEEDHFNPEVFTKSRIDRFQTLKQCPRYCKGWEKRAKWKLKLYYTLI